jgi:hypothetical protein
MDDNDKNKKTKQRRAPVTNVVDAGSLATPTEPLDPEIRREFYEAQRRRGSGTEHLARQLAEHHSQSPELTAGDIDAAWTRSDVGEESPGGSVTTPDQSVVDDIGEAVGLTFEDNEPVDVVGKMNRRDRRRWELNPSSAEDRGDHTNIEKE